MLVSTLFIKSTLQNEIGKNLIDSGQKAASNKRLQEKELRNRTVLKVDKN